MNRIFKFKYLPILALVLSGGFAVATELTVVDPNVFNDNASTTGTPSWQPIVTPADATCGAASARPCKGYQATAGGTVQNIVTGAKP